MKELVFKEIDGGKPFYMLLGFMGLFVLTALGAAWYMEHNGHWVTGMNNQIVWGTPHVFAVFLIVAASGALNVASISSVFNKKAYKPLARLSGLLAIALLVGGLAVLVLDLGRPDRLIIAMTFGDMNDPDSELSQQLKQHSSRQIRADLELNTGVRYRGI